MKTDIEKSLGKVRKKLKQIDKSEQIMLTKLREELRQLKRELEEEKAS